MATILKKEVVDRLLMAKALLAKGRLHPVADPDRYFVAEQILMAQDAGELALAAVADQVEKSPPKEKRFIMDYFGSLKELHPSREVTGKEYFRRLNEARIGIKHIGNFPDAHQWARVAEEVYGYACEWCQDYLQLSFGDMDESGLIADGRVKAYYDSAKRNLAEQNYEQALVEVGYALHLLFKQNRALSDVEVGDDKAEVAIRLTGFGVHANDFLTLQQFLPKVWGGPEIPADHTWCQALFGHPANWRKETVEFCLQAFVQVALKVQAAPWIPTPLNFNTVYLHRVTALEDGVQLWKQEFITLPGLVPSLAVNPVTKRKVRELRKGETLLGVVSPIRSEISRAAAFGGRRGDIETIEILVTDPSEIVYTSFKSVKVTCVPRDSIKPWMPDLPEIDWQPE